MIIVCVYFVVYHHTGISLQPQHWTLAVQMEAMTANVLKASFVSCMCSFEHMPTASASWLKVPDISAQYCTFSLQHCAAVGVISGHTSVNKLEKSGFSGNSRHCSVVQTTTSTYSGARIKIQVIYKPVTVLATTWKGYMENILITSSCTTCLLPFKVW